MTIDDLEWASLSELWVSERQRVDAAPLRRRVAAHRRLLVVTTAVEVALFVALMWITYAVLSKGLTPWKLVWAATLWGFAAIACAFVLWNRKGTWRTAGDSVADHVRLMRKRAGRQWRSLWFGIGLFIAESVVAIAQLVWFGRFTMLAAALIAGSAVVVAAWFVVARRKIRRDLAIAAEKEED